jgi:hypothetical protein
MKINTRFTLVMAALVFGVALTINQVALGVAESGPENPAAVLLVLIRLSNLVCWFSMIVALLAGGVLAIQWVTKNASKLGLEDEPKPREVDELKSKKEDGGLQQVETLAHATGQVNQTIESIDQQIDEIQRRRGNAFARLEVIRGLTDDLTRMVRAIAGQAAGMNHRRDLLIRLRAAIGKNETSIIAEVLGELGDQSLKTLLLDQNNMVYLDRVNTMVSSEIGNLQGRSDALVTLIQVWVDQIGQFREEVASMNQIVMSSEALPVILQIQDGLNQAHRALGMTQEDVVLITTGHRVPSHMFTNGPAMIEGPHS